MRWFSSLCALCLTVGSLVSGCDKTDELALATNRLCTSDKSCPGTLTCGTGKSTRGQCIQPCAKTGPGPESGCPAGTFCYVPPEAKEEGHCTAICSTDKDCQERHPTLVCKERTATEEWALQICILPGS